MQIEINTQQNQTDWENDCFEGEAEAVFYKKHFETLMDAAKIGESAFDEACGKISKVSNTFDCILDDYTFDTFPTRFAPLYVKYSEKYAQLKSMGVN